MRTTLVRCCDAHPAANQWERRWHCDFGWLSVPSTLTPFGNGEFRTVLSEAIGHDHYCDDAGCDISRAVSNGYVTAAYHLLTGATEAHGCEALVSALDTIYGADTVRAVLGSHLYDCPDWDGWEAHHREWGRQCESCFSYTYADDYWEPTQCSNCLASLPVREDESEDDESE